jgi:hypothetical protein
MLDLIKPNTEWKELAKEFEGTFKPGGLLSPTQMHISKNSLTFNIKTSYSNDNFWSARTIIYCTFHYRQDCSIKIKKNIWTSILRQIRGNLNVSRGYKELKQELLNNYKLNEFRKSNNSFLLSFKTEGIIAENYEVLPKIELKLKGFLTKKEEFDTMFEVIEELASTLIKRKIISSAPNNK